MTQAIIFPVCCECDVFKFIQLIVLLIRPLIHSTIMIHSWLVRYCIGMNFLLTFDNLCYTNHYVETSHTKSLLQNSYPPFAFWNCSSAFYSKMYVVIPILPPNVSFEVTKLPRPSTHELRTTILIGRGKQYGYGIVNSLQKVLKSIWWCDSVHSSHEISVCIIQTIVTTIIHR